MKLTDFARQLPQEVCELFEPLLPPVVWCGNGRPPASNYDCLHALFYVLVSGIAWRMLPKGFPSYKTVQRRLKGWLQRDAFRTAWQQLAHRYEALQGINWDQILLFFAQFGRVFRRFDRSARRYLAWIEMAACVILLRSGFVS